MRLSADPGLADRALHFEQAARTVIASRLGIGRGRRIKRRQRALGGRLRENRREQGA